MFLFADYNYLNHHPKAKHFANKIITRNGDSMDTLTDSEVSLAYVQYNNHVNGDSMDTLTDSEVSLAYVYCIIITRNGDSMDTLTDSEVSLTHTLQLYFMILSQCFDFIFVVPEQYFRGGKAIFSMTHFRYLLFSKRPFPLLVFF